MELTNQQTLPVGQAHAWEALNDISLLQAAIPGCEGITPTGDNQYEVLVMAAIGPVKAKFKGKLQLENLQPPTSYTIRFEGQGGAAGHGKGHADIRLESAGAAQTVLHYTAHASVGGKIAQIGSRLVDMAAQKMATEFFETFNARLQERYAVVAPTPVAEPAPAGLFARLVAWLKRLFGG
ncbi:CoxG family protein [Ideonella sp. A 288]|uniref:CoxG family protein n=1 Tax=Ideonella sp. A 288 TaxID=1962181 RepID=UPI000B4BCF7D|nr:carbon monoxide dehydrogenase subunit G [Ideonella sp. A 288]